MSSKFGNVAIRVDGIRFASKREARRYQALRLMEKAGAIHNLHTQAPFDIAFGGVKICRYIADFTYLEKGCEIVEDCKGMRTPVYKLKAKLMFAVNGIRIRET